MKKYTRLEDNEQLEYSTNNIFRKQGHYIAYRTTIIYITIAECRNKHIMVPLLNFHLTNSNHTCIAFQRTSLRQLFSDNKT